ncbi:MAG: SAM-dependent methyltransferase [Simkania sp.]|nr:SAM-dependent methyltransferase [Simkania sp.]
MKGTLYLLPNLLHSEASMERYMPKILWEVVNHLHGLIAESPKEGRAFLKRMGRAPASLLQGVLNEHSTPEEIEVLLTPLRRGETWGYVTDAGMPCFADPGAQLVARARQEDIAIEAIIGPSSILLAIMLCGLPSQRFAFHGYLPQDPIALKKAIKSLEKRSQEEAATQLFIETPYRNLKLFKALLQDLSLNTKLSVLCNLTAPDELVITQTIAQWKKALLPDLDKKPTLFIFLA